MSDAPGSSAFKFPNGYGGYDPVGNEYVVFIASDKWTPAPWVNILANTNFGTLVSESGSSFTWSKNSYFFRITPWIGDWISDPSGELVYLQDLDDRQVWTPTPLPMRKDIAYTVRHGIGYSTFESEFNQVRQKLTMFVARQDPIKFLRLKLTNNSHRHKRIAAYFYIELVLGDFKDRTKDFLLTTVDNRKRLILARNLSMDAFSDEIAFAGSTDNRARVSLCERKNFFGEGSSISVPELFNGGKRGGKQERFNDPCGVVKVLYNLKPGEEKEVVFFLGSSKHEHISRILSKYKSIEEIDNEYKSVGEFWKGLNTIKIQTPEESLNVLFNDWLLYQVLSSRLWGRTGFYQPGGAYGFRDQLQDALALVWSKPNFTKRQILLASSHQYKDGNVNRWWHTNVMEMPSSGSDDCLWIVYATTAYIEVTKDFDILKEKTSFKGTDKDSQSTQEGTLYDHCVVALERVIGKMGKHGLPLILSGDWNDSYSKVGVGGVGESVWLAMFLIYNLKRFLMLCQRRGDTERAKKYERTMNNLIESVEKFGWDGNWFLRAYYDDGSVLGGGENTQGKIDSLSQSWSVIADEVNREKAQKAMESLKKYLVDEDRRLILLVSPPFDNPEMDPGYVKDYPPGVRENGSQYNHAALWVVLAFLMLGDGDTAVKLLDMMNSFKRWEEDSAYNVEPYVLSSDIYSGQFSGRGGWTWYTGSAGVMYRVVLENLLGLKFRGQTLEISPCVPKSWKTFSAMFKYNSSNYKLIFENKRKGVSATTRVMVDGTFIQDKLVHLADDGQSHLVKIVLE